MIMHLRAVAIALSLLTIACGPSEPPPPAPVTLSESWHCTYSSNGSTWTHDVYGYSDGSVMATCEVAGRYTSVFAMALYRATQGGAADGGCTLTDDWDTTGSGGWWNFRFSASTSRANYNDISSQLNGSSIPLACERH